jgi:hypothetical protein
VDANAASGVINRFKIVFKQNVVLPVTFVNVKAYYQKSNVAVDWKVTNQVNVAGYEIEKSINGHDFIKGGTKTVAGNAGETINYQWLDENVVAGDNFYRVISIDINGSKHYSQVVKVDAATEKYVIIKPGKDLINLQFNGW